VGTGSAARSGVRNKVISIACNKGIDKRREI
jgi:hypothetical protein